MESIGPGDEQRIVDIIMMYDRQNPDGPDSIAMSVLSAKREQQDLELQGAISRKTGIVKNSPGRRLSVVMPEGLYLILRKQYPTLLGKDIQWFKKHFPMFVINK